MKGDDVVRLKPTLLLSVLFATSLLGSAAAQQPAVPTEAPPPAFCAAPTTDMTEDLQPVAPPFAAKEAATTEVRCSSYCSSYQCLGFIAGSAICGTSYKPGICTAATDICSTDHRVRCFCKLDSGA
jgi:hypothetical protein